jgi:hypothetical protein
MICHSTLAAALGLGLANGPWCCPRWERFEPLPCYSWFCLLLHYTIVCVKRKDGPPGESISQMLGRLALERVRYIECN